MRSLRHDGDVDVATDPTGPSPGRATIGDVAQRAGVSVATVSRALRGLPNVASSTRQRIQRAADELRYRPDPAAARLAAGRTSTLTVGIPQLSGWYYSNVVAGAEAVCAAQEFEIQVVGLGATGHVDRLLDPANRIERRTDALILVDIDLDADRAEQLRARGVQVGTIGFHVPGCPAVQTDDDAVGRLAARHLVEVGCRRPAMLVGLPDDPMRLRVPGLRRAGFEQQLESLGVGSAPLVSSAAFGIHGGRAAMAELLDRSTPDDRPDGVFTMSDEMAFGAIMELRARGLHTGVGNGRVAMVGVDDHEFAQVVDLTTIHQDVPALGATLAKRLIDAINAAPPVPPSSRHDDDGDGDGDGDGDEVADGEVVRPEITLVRRASTTPGRGV